MVRIAAATCIAFAAVACDASAADYPNRPIRLLVSFGAGGPTDIPARFVAEKLGDRLGQRVVVENKTDTICCSARTSRRSTRRSTKMPDSS
jgi:tripartite-type tricarboxylate transporter receptor subunit TctC